MTSAFRYPAQIEPNGEGGFIASFRDIPEALTEAWTEEELQKNTLDALITAIDFYIEDRRRFPNPLNSAPGIWRSSSPPP